MLRKIALASLAVVAGLFILNSTHLGSYAKTAWNKVRTAAKAQVPLEYQLETIRNEVSQFMPEMKKQISSLAYETVKVKELRDDISEIRASLGKQGDRILAMKNDLQSRPEKTSLEGRTASTDRLRNRLERALTAYKTCGAELKAKENLLEAKEQALAFEQEKLASMKAQKEQWEVEIARMETELKTLRLAQTKCSFQLDDSKFSTIKGMIADVKNQIKVQQTENDMWGAFSNDAVVAEKKARSEAQLIKEVEETFSDNADLKVEAKK